MSDNLSGGDFHALGTCQGSPGGSSYCGPGCPCPEGVGDCDPDFDCSPECPCEENEGDCDEDADSATCPCAITEADCDSDAECEAGLACVRNVGAQYGYAADTDVCLPNSSTPVCGNLAVETGEVCDDGNVVDGDGCDADCVPTIADLDVGEAHTCIVTRAGQLKCWGFDLWVLGYDLPVHERALGDDEILDTVGYVPLDTPVRQVLARYGHTCVILKTGAVRCWGANDYGYLGYGHRDHPVFAWEAGDLDIGGNAVQLAGGYFHTCALLDTGAVRCWGYYYGLLSYGALETVGDDETPAEVGDVSLGGRAVQISSHGNWHRCAVLDTGALRCWGRNQSGQLGLGNKIHIGDNELPSTAPTVNMGAGVIDVAAGGSNTCALLNHGGLRCWGDGNDGGHGYGHELMLGDNESPASFPDLPLW